MLLQGKLNETEGNDDWGRCCDRRRGIVRFRSQSRSYQGVAGSETERKDAMKERRAAGYELLDNGR